MNLMIVTIEGKENRNQSNTNCKSKHALTRDTYAVIKCICMYNKIAKSYQNWHVKVR